MKKTGSIFILALVAMHLLGGYVYFAIRLNEIHREVKAKIAQLPDESLTRLEISYNEYQKLHAADGELKYNGKMYDVVRANISGQKVILYAWQDEAEDNLLSLLNELVTRNQKDKKPVPGSIIQWSTISFICEMPLSIYVAKIAESHFSKYEFRHTNISSSIETPPPKIG